MFITLTLKIKFEGTACYGLRPFEEKKKKWCVYSDIYNSFEIIIYCYFNLRILFFTSARLQLVLCVDNYFHFSLYSNRAFNDALSQCGLAPTGVWKSWIYITQTFLSHFSPELNFATSRKLLRSPEKSLIWLYV